MSIRMSKSVRSAGAASPPGSWGRYVVRAGVGPAPTGCSVLTALPFRRKVNKRCRIVRVRHMVLRGRLCAGHLVVRSGRFHLGNQKDFAGGAASFQVTVCLCRFRKRIRCSDPDREGSLGSSIKDLS